MNFTRFNCDSQVLYIEIKEPEEYDGVTYYYPDGLTRGVFKKKPISPVLEVSLVVVKIPIMNLLRI